MKLRATPGGHEGRDRFARYTIENHESDPERTGLLPCGLDYELGTASLRRRETIRLFGASCRTNERLLLKLKWRPANEELVTLISELELTTSDGRTFRHESVESYRPERADAAVGAGAPRDRRIISQYGSSGAPLKLRVLNPYRRLRLTFSGHMQQVEGASERAFVRLGCVLQPCGQIFDFLAKSSKFAARDKRGCFPISKASAQLRALHDRHEQKVRFDGEYTLQPCGGNAEAQLDAANVAQPPESKHQFSLRGFYVRHLLETGGGEFAEKLTTTRLYVSLQNGKSFQVGSSWRPACPTQANGNSAAGATNDPAHPSCETEEVGQKPELCFGFAHFALNPMCASLSDFSFPIFEQIRSPQRMLAANQPLVVCSRQQGGELLSCQLSAPSHSGNWFQVAAEPAWLPSNLKRAAAAAAGKAAVKLPGWAHWSGDDEICDSEETRALIARSLRERAQAIESGAMLDSRDDEPPRGAQERPLVVSLEARACASSALTGAKAASLAQLGRFCRTRPEASETQFQVPRGIVLTRHAYELLVEANKELVETGLLRLIDALQEAAAPPQAAIEAKEREVRRRCGELQELVAKKIQALPERLMGELRAKLAQEFQETRATGLVAVRSSSWGEDEGDMSAAGQLSTILNVPLEDERQVVAAILVCFASKFSYENVQYKRQHGLPLDLPMAVVVQAMVACEKAGVMFTCDPVSGNERQLVITANYGLGESVVSAQADPDSIVVGVEPASESLRVLRVHIGSKLVTVLGAEQTSGGESAPAGQQQQQQQQQADKSECCLSEAEILQLARVGCRLRRYFQARQRHCDIEFGFLKGQLHLFQCRPVTGLEAPSEQELLHEFNRVCQSELVFYSRANVGEVLPYAIKPLALTSLINHFAVTTAQMELDCQPPVGARRLRAERLYVPQCTMPDFAVEKYHAFFNLFGSNWLKLGEPGERTAMSRSLEIGMFGREIEPQLDLMEASQCFEPPPDPYNSLTYKLKTWRIRLAPARYVESVRKRIERLYKQLLRQMDDEEPARFEPDERAKVDRLLELYAQFRAAFRASFITWKLHIGATLLDSEHHLELNKLLANYIDDPVKLSVAANKFLALTQDVISAEIPARIKRVAQLTLERRSDFLELDDASALEWLNGQQEFVEFVDKFGHRCYSEFDISAPTWREQPALLLEMVRTNCRALASAGDARGQSSESDCETSGAKLTSVEQVIEALNLRGKLGKLDELRLKRFLVPRCQLYLATRERTKNTFILYVGCVRAAARLLAREMRLQMRLPDNELLYFVPLDELELLCRNYRPQLVMQALRRRQLFARHFPPEQAWKFDEIIRSPELLPNHLKPNRELDEQLKRAPKLLGTPASSGKARGRVCLIESYQQLARVAPGSILLTHSTDIAFSPVFPLIRGIITEVGGLISHGAVVAREYGLPSVIGIPNVTRILQDGELVLLDADNGAIVRLSPPPPDA